ncbi:hypothetical protein ACPOL_3770 [Acidisarcina polymorpha]|uniref:TIGR03118 family protein n=1 Tax=Acidisarcina polymorpha TaxID=2211140 RepID=A0A2Z5G1U0_9BACT|nr:hypothetical protein ACPOL_3770 [Acidisarcina polymorpha]
MSTLYNGVGQKQSLVVTIPPADPTNKLTPNGSPTGVVANGSATEFKIAPGDPAVFIFSTIDGTIAAWNPKVNLAKGQAAPSTHAITVAKGATGSVYTGLTSGFINGKRFLYAANFGRGRVDVYDTAFFPVTLHRSGSDGDRHDEYRNPSDNEPFVDDQLPPDFVPFNVQAIGDDIVVTYVLHLQGSPVETDGPGLGYVDIYSSSGKLLNRLEHGDWLNAPWGVALAPLDFGRFSHHLLVGQFAGGGTTQSSGLIAAYDLATGRFDGVLQDAGGKPLSIQGIWALSPANLSPATVDPDQEPASEIYFTAAPNHGTGGLFGYLNAVSDELTEGSVQ